MDCCRLFALFEAINSNEDLKKRVWSPPRRFPGTRATAVTQEGDAIFSISARSAVFLCLHISVSTYVSDVSDVTKELKQFVFEFRPIIK